MRAKDPDLDPLLARSSGYVVFPDIGKGGFVVGGAYGRGVLYQHGQQAGFVDLSQASVGAQVGAQAYSELVVFAQPYDVDRLKAGKFELGANASAVVLTAGAAGATDPSSGVSVFVVPKGGAMAELSVSGQKLNFSKGG
jgi:lipid-binding SYLF domain-containing protein